MSSRPTNSAAWGLLAGIAGSLCCLGPSAAVLLGLGASSALAGVQLERLPALGAGLALLIVGVLLAYRRARMCGLTPAARARGPLVALLSFGLAYAVLAYVLPALAAQQIYAEAAATAPASFAAPAASTAPSERLVISIIKMDCPPCVAKVHATLAQEPGVRAFVAELNVDEVTIDYDPSVVSAERLAGLFPSSYQVEIVSESVLPAHD